MLVLRTEQSTQHAKESAAARLAPRRLRKHHASRLEWLEWTTILVSAALVLAALNTALPVISDVMRGFG